MNKETIINMSLEDKGGIVTVTPGHERGELLSALRRDYRGVRSIIIEVSDYRIYIGVSDYRI